MEDARDLRQRGIRAAKAGQKNEARQLLQQSIRLEPNNEAAWLWLASVARDNRERLFCLQKILEINPQNETALKALEAANQNAPAESSARRLPDAPATAAPAQPDVANQAPGVPMPMPDRIAEAQKQAETVLRAYLTPLPATVKWVHKTRRRAGESDILVYRMYVSIAILVFVVILLAAGVFVVQTNADVRYVVLGPSATPTPSPTLTPTPTPGFTPTPSPTPRLSPTPSDTPPANLLAASPHALPHATKVYPEILERQIQDAVELMDQGAVSRAVPTLEHERQLNFDTGRLNPNPYYYEAIGLAAQGKFSDALAALDEAKGRLQERPDDKWIEFFLDAGYAQVYWDQHEQAVANGNPSLASEALANVQQNAQAAMDGDKDLPLPYLLMAKVNLEQKNYDGALQVLNQGLNVASLTSNTELLMERAEVYFEQGDYEAALHQVFLALYVDPSIEAAYQLKIKIAMTRNRPGDAVLAAQDYLHYYPGSTTAYLLLGQAREAENKPDLAILVYTQGLAGDVRDESTQQMLKARAELYDQSHHYDLALADYKRLYQITNDPAVQSLAMREAFDAGQYDQALTDAQALAGNKSVPQGMVDFVQGAVLIEQADSGSNAAAYRQAVQFLQQAVGASDVAAANLRGTANEYLARAEFEVRNYSAALDAINTALSVAETGSRHYWRGRILQQRGDTKGAISDYEWVTAWSAIYPYPFRVDAQDRLTTLKG